MAPRALHPENDRSERFECLERAREAHRRGRDRRDLQRFAPPTVPQPALVGARDGPWRRTIRRVLSLAVRFARLRLALAAKLLEC